MAFPDESNLTTLPTLKAYLDPPPSGASADTMLTALINRASNLIAEEINDVQIASATITEKRNGGNQTLILRRRPVTSVTSVTVGTATIPASVNGTNGFVLDPDVNAVWLIGSDFGRGVQNVTVVYVAGIPSGHRWLGMLEQACLSTCALWWKRRAHIDQQSAAAPNGLGSLSFVTRDIPADAREIINQIKGTAQVFG